LLLSENKSIQFLQGDPLENVVRVANKNVLMIHGHQMGRNLGQSCDMLTRKYAKRNIIIDFIISGHIHECYISDLYARGGSLVGPNSYSENALNLSSRASQNLYVINNEDKIDVRIDLQNSNKFNGYNIDEKLASYNAKSFDKTKIRKSIMEIVI
jgi:predicted phosphodiesterase